MSETYDDILPNPGFTAEKGKTAVVVTDPQKDFLSEDGVVWGVVGASVEANNTVEHLGQLLTAAHDAGLPVFVSPHYYFPHDHKWNGLCFRWILGFWSDVRWRYLHLSI